MSWVVVIFEEVRENAVRQFTSIDPSLARWMRVKRGFPRSNKIKCDPGLYGMSREGWKRMKRTGFA